MQYLHLTLTSERIPYAPLESSFLLLTFALLWHLYCHVILFPPGPLILRWQKHTIKKIRYTLNPRIISNNNTPTSEAPETPPSP